MLLSRVRPSTSTRAVIIFLSSLLGVSIVIIGLLITILNEENSPQLKASSPAPAEIDLPVIKIKVKDYKKITDQIEAAKKTGVLLDEKFYSAEILFQDKVFSAKIRPKGDWSDHLNLDKPSLRIKLKGDDSILGMQQFSIQHPKTRNYLNEWFFHQAAKKLGIVSLNFDFVRIEINGKNYGIFCIEQFFDDLLVEKNRQRKGPIVKFDDNPFWRSVAMTSINHENSANLKNSPVVVIESREKSPDFKRLGVSAVRAMSNLQTNSIGLESLINYDLLAKYLAIVDLLGSRHAQVFTNLRFFQNPMNGKLEPIAFDGSTGSLTMSLIADPSTKEFIKISERFDLMFWGGLKSDTELLERYVKALSEILDSNFLESLLLETQSARERLSKELNKEFVDNAFDVEIYKMNEKFIRSSISPKSGYQASYNSDLPGGAITVRIRNSYKLPIQVYGLAGCGKTVILQKRTVAKVTWPDGRDQSFSFEPILGCEGPFRLHIGILGASQSEWVTLPKAIPAEQMPILNGNAIPSFVTKDLVSRKLIIRRGEWSLSKTWEIPPGLELYIQSGTTLRLLKGGAVVSHSPIIALGTETEPIQIIGTQSSGNGFALLESAGNSRFHYVRFLGLSPIEDNRLLHTGGLVVFRSKVYLFGCEISHNASGDDALNIVNSTFEIERTHFFRTTSDALDIDFSDGLIKDSKFDDVGGDAVDTSGSSVIIENSRITHARDKGVSAGEASKLTISKIEVEDSNIGIASKDQSVVTVTNSRLVNNRMGLVVFEKKRQFGPAKILISNSTFSDNQEPFLLERGSYIQSNGSALEANRVDLRSDLY